MDESSSVPRSTPLAEWIDRLSTATGAPGGGAACGVILGLCAALGGMVANYTSGDARAAECGARLAALRTEALAAAESDGVISGTLGEALALDSSDSRRDGRVRDTALVAARSSVALGDIAVALRDQLRVLSEIGNPSVLADLAVAGQALAAGLAGAWINLLADVKLACAHGAEDSSTAELDALRAAGGRLDQTRGTVLRLNEELTAQLTR